MPTVDIIELKQTVQRMEQYLRAHDAALVRELMASYDELRSRFSHDLQDERDMLLSCGGALMLIQQVAHRTTPPKSKQDNV
jgi:hypothetical protein